jgi:folylpolyglutamate synthase/dihydropteroate synthase
MEHFHKAEDWLLELSSEAQFFRKDTPPSLEVVQLVLDALGRPDESFEWRVVVGGTAGKGTVCRLTEDVLLTAGKTVATLMSPHLQVITERVRINGKLIEAETFGFTLLEIKKVCEDLSILPTYYEAIVLTGILSAKNAGCEILICEVGMGGRLDAVNSVQGKRVSALTFIGDDHLEKFDNSLSKLAEEKAGIFVENSVYNISYEQKMCSTLNKIAKKDIHYIKGVMTKLNKKMTRNICEEILGSDTFTMRKIQLPGRWEKVAPDVILDGAHSAPRFEFILPKIKKLKGPKIGIFGLGKNHDPNIFNIVEKEFEEIFWVNVPEARDTWTAEELKQKLGRGITCPDAHSALKEARKLGGTILVNGFFLGGEMRNEFYDPQKILEQQTEFPE